MSDKLLEMLLQIFKKLVSYLWAVDCSDDGGGHEHDTICEHLLNAQGKN